MKRLLLIVLPLLLIVGCSKVEGQQQLIPQITETYDNGNIKTIIYHKKTRDGVEKVKWESYRENGKKWRTRIYKENKSIINSIGHKGDYLETYWYENGQKGYEGTFKDGIEDGLMKTWHENGQKWGEINYNDGIVMSSICFDVNGDECGPCWIDKFGGRYSYNPCGHYFD